jgi:hypothetical protein
VSERDIILEDNHMRHFYLTILLSCFFLFGCVEKESAYQQRDESIGQPKAEWEAPLQVTNDNFQLKEPSADTLEKSNEEVLNSLKKGNTQMQHPGMAINDPATQDEIDSYFGADLWGGAYDVRGTNLVIGLFEAGGFPNNTLPELTTRITEINRDSTIGGTAFNSHATNVARRLIGNGTGTNRGIAPEASIEAWYTGADEALEELPDRLANGTLPLMLVSNHSYDRRSGWFSGSPNWWSEVNVDKEIDYKFGRYDERDQIFDEVSVNHPHHTIVMGAGNRRGTSGSFPVTAFITPDPPTGTPGDDYGQYTYDPDPPISDPLPETQDFDCISMGNIGKNVITVGSANQISGGYDLPSDVVIQANSSAGPTDDGRIKPDLVAPSSFQTSGAAPQVSGSILLLQELHEKTFGHYMTNSTVKGLLIHTAYQVGTKQGPTYDYGWGMINPKGAADFMLAQDEAHTMLESTLADGETHTYMVYTTGDLKSTITWADPAFTPIPRTYLPADLNNATPHLINDLDMRLAAVETPGTPFLPWVLDPANPTVAATRGDNTRDNIEQIVETGLDPGWHQITVQHKGTLADPQPYSLMISGGQAVCRANVDLTKLSTYDSGWSGGKDPGDDVLIKSNLTVGATDEWKHALLTPGVKITLDADVTITGNLVVPTNAEFDGPGKLIVSGTANQTLCGCQVPILELDNALNEATISSRPFLVTDKLILQNGTLNTADLLKLQGLQGDADKRYAILENNGGSINGDLTYGIWIEGAEGWRHLSAPVTTTVGDLVANTSNFRLLSGIASIYLWDKAAANWVAPANVNTAIEANTPFTMFFGTTTIEFTPMPFFLEMTGPVHSGVISNTLTYEESPIANSEEGWNFIGNPYPQPLNWREVAIRAGADGNVDNAYYVWDQNEGTDGDYLVRSGVTAGDDGTGNAPLFIAPGQGYFVKLNSSSGTSTSVFNFEESDRSSTRAAHFKAQTPQVRLLVNKDTYADHLILGFSENKEVSTHFNSNFDAYKLPHPGKPGIRVFRQADATNPDLAIKILPENLPFYIIPLALKADDSGEVSFDVVRDGIPGEWLFFIHDKLAGDRLLPLDTTFEVGILEKDRFALHIYKKRTDIPEKFNPNPVKIWKSTSEIVVTFGRDTPINHIRILGIDGSVLYEQKSPTLSQVYQISNGLWKSSKHMGIIVEVQETETKNTSRQLIAF